MNSKDMILEVLKQTTYPISRSKMEEFAEKYELKSVKKLLESDKDIIWIKKREEAKERLINDFTNQENPTICFVAEYGSGKTAILKNIVKKIKDGEIKYGDITLYPIHYQIHGQDTLKKFLAHTFKNLESKIPFDKLQEIYLETREEESSQLDTFLPKEELTNTEQLAIDLKRHAEYVNEIWAILEKLFLFFEEYTKTKIVLIIDEIENLGQLGEEDALRKIIAEQSLKHALRNYRKNPKNPPLITIFNIANVQNLKLIEDTTDRLESVRNDINLTPEDSIELMKRLLRKYFTSFNEDLKDKYDFASKWLEELEKNSNFDDEYFSYPFSQDFHEYVAHNMLKIQEEHISSFRGYKDTVEFFLDGWDGSSIITKNSLWKLGSDFRSSLNEQQLRNYKLENIPNDGLIKDTIDDIFVKFSRFQRFMSSKIFRHAILEREDISTIYLSKTELEKINYGVEVGEGEISNLFDNIKNYENDFVEIENSTILVFNKSEFLKKVEGKYEKKDLLEEETASILDRDDGLSEKLKHTDLLEVLGKYYESIGWVNSQYEEGILTVRGIAKPPKYVIEYYVFTNKKLEEEVKKKVEESKSFNPGICIRETEEFPYVAFDVILPKGFSSTENRFSIEIKKILHDNKEKIDELLAILQEKLNAEKTECMMQLMKIWAYLHYNGEIIREYDDLRHRIVTFNFIKQCQLNQQEQLKWDKIKLGFTKTIENITECVNLQIILKLATNKGKNNLLLSSDEYNTEIPKIADEDLPIITNIRPQGYIHFDDWNNVVLPKLSEESFVGPNSQISPPDTWDKILYDNLILVEKELEKKQKMEFNDLKKLIFGTGELRPTAEMALSLFLLLGEKFGRWVIELPLNKKITGLKILEKKKTIVEEIGKLKENSASRLKSTLLYYFEVQNAERKDIIGNILSLKSKIEALSPDSEKHQVDRHRTSLDELHQKIGKMEIKHIDETILHNKVLKNNYPKIGEYIRELNKLIIGNELLGYSLGERPKTLSQNIYRDLTCIGLLETQSEYLKKLARKAESDFNESSLLKVVGRGESLTEDWVHEHSTKFNRILDRAIDVLTVNNQDDQLSSFVGEIGSVINDLIDDEWVGTYSEEDIRSLENSVQALKEEIIRLLDEKIKEAEKEIENANQKTERRVYSSIKSDILSVIRRLNGTKLNLEDAKADPLEYDIQSLIKKIDGGRDELGKLVKKAIEDRQTEITEFIKQKKLSDVSIESILENSGYSETKLKELSDEIGISIVDVLREPENYKEQYKRLVCIFAAQEFLDSLSGEEQ